MRDMGSVLNELIKKQRSEIVSSKKWTSERDKIEAQYGDQIPSEIIELYDVVSGGFLAISEFNSWQIFTPVEILEASEELQVDFVGLALLPIIDCMDNDLLCYDFNNVEYVIFNVVDEESFSGKPNLVDFFMEAMR